MKELFKSISKTEWQFVGLMAFLLIIITGLPYFYGFLAAPAGYVYNGLTSLTPADNPVYYSYINQVKEGNILVKDLFTTEDQSGLFNIFWLGAGIFAKILSLPPVLAFHLLRLIFIPVFIVVAYLFISLFFKEVVQRKICLFLLVFSSGLGAYFIGQIVAFDFSNKPGYWTPNDIWIPESITFMTLYKTSHFIASVTLMLLIFLLMIKAFSLKRLSYIVTAGVLALVYFNFHPFYIPMVFGTLGLYLLFLIIKERRILWQESFYFLLFILISTPSIIYHFWSLLSSPVLVQRAFQNITLAPPFVFILIGYGFLWPLALIGVLALAKNKRLSNHFVFLLLWLLFSLLLVNLPFQFQSRYTQGLHLPLVIFSVVGLFFLKEKFLTPQRLQKYDFWLNNKALIIILLVLFVFITNIFNLVRDFYYFTYKPGPTIDYFYLSKNKVEAIKEFKSLPPGQKVFANSAVDALFIPGLANQSVYLGHSIETINYVPKVYYFQWFFYSDKQPEKKRDFLLKNDIDYIFFNLSQKKTGYFEPATKDYLQLFYQNPDIKIYQVIKS